MKHIRLAGLTALLLTAVATAADTQDGPAIMPGATMRVYEVGQKMSAIPKLIEGQTPNISKRIDQIDLRENDFGIADRFYVEILAKLEIKESGKHRFHLTSDDGSMLLIGGKLVIDHNGLHGRETKSAGIELARGQHDLLIRFFENQGRAELKLEWSPPGENTRQLVPTAALNTVDQVHVTSPGKKKVELAHAASAWPDTPGTGRPLVGHHPAFDLITIHPRDFNPKVGGIDFLSDGRLVLCTWDATGGVYLLDNVRGAEADPDKVTVKRIAAGLAEPLGLCVVPDPGTGKDRIFVLQKQELTELIDHTGDEVIDEYRCISDQWAVSPNFHEFAFGLIHRNGKFYGTLAVAINPGGKTTREQSPGRGTLREIDLETGEARMMASGFRTPNGVGFGPRGTIAVTDNQGAWRPASTMHLATGGEFFGHFMPNPAQDPPNAKAPVTPPAIWLPQGEIGNSPAQPILIKDGTYKGQMLHAEVTHGGIKRDFLENIGGVWQGCVFRFSQGLEAGVNRLVIGPDGAIYAGCIGATGNWSHRGRRTGLQKLMPNGNTAFEMRAVRAMNNGFEIEFTQPLAQGIGWGPGDYRVQQWRYEPTTRYGGRKIDQQAMPAKSASVSADRRRVFIEIPDLKPGHVTHLRLAPSLVSEAGEALWSGETWYTLNVIPTDRQGAVLDPPRGAALAAEEDEGEQNVLTEAQEAAGWRLLFDGQSADPWRGFRKDHLPGGWQAQDGAIARVGKGGDIITKEQFDNFELKLQWKISEGGNSGIFYRVAEEVDGKKMGATWHTGAEMQVLDNNKHRDGRNPKTSAGANYALHPAPRDAPRPVGQWNDVHLIADGNKITYRLNGVVTAEYEIGSEAWEERVAHSKFKKMPYYGRVPKGHIALQDHGNPVWYRNIMIRPLPQKPAN